MAITSVRLVDGTREMTLIPRTDITVNRIDAPFPDVRAVTEPRADDDGERDTTELFGARAATIDMEVYTTPAAIVDELKTFCHPRSRPYLVVDDTEWDRQRRLRLRVDQLSDPVESGADDVYRQVQAQWRVPDGVWEDVDVIESTVRADMAATVGFSFPLVFPFSFEQTEASGARLVDNPGGTETHFTARLYGPCLAPRLTNETTGETLDFSAFSFGAQLTLGSGEYVEINTRDRSALLLSNKAASRLAFLDYLTSTWWRLQPGTNEVRYHPFDADPGAAAVIEFRPVWF